MTKKIRVFLTFSGKYSKRHRLTTSVLRISQDSTVQENLEDVVRNYFSISGSYSLRFSINDYEILKSQTSKVLYEGDQILVEISRCREANSDFATSSPKEPSSPKRKKIKIAKSDKPPDAISNAEFSEMISSKPKPKAKPQCKDVQQKTICSTALQPDTTIKPPQMVPRKFIARKPVTPISPSKASTTSKKESLAVIETTSRRKSIEGSFPTNSSIPAKPVKALSPLPLSGSARHRGIPIHSHIVFSESDDSNDSEPKEVFNTEAAEQSVTTANSKQAQESHATDEPPKKSDQPAVDPAKAVGTDTNLLLEEEKKKLLEKVYMSQKTLENIASKEQESSSDSSDDDSEIYSKISAITASKTSQKPVSKLKEPMKDCQLQLKRVLQKQGNVTTNDDSSSDSSDEPTTNVFRKDAIPSMPTAHLKPISNRKESSTESESDSDSSSNLPPKPKTNVNKKSELSKDVVRSIQNPKALNIFAVTKLLNQEKMHCSPKGRGKPFLSPDVIPRMVQQLNEEQTNKSVFYTVDSTKE